MNNGYNLVLEEIWWAQNELHPSPEPPLQFYYRGHADKDWNLEPSIVRAMREQNQENFPEQHRITERSELQRAIRTGNWSLTDDIFTNIARMQHYGYKTRFLDYSTCFNVALYFACNDEQYYDRDGVLSICLYTNDRHAETPDTLAISELALLSNSISLYDFATSIVVNHGKAIEKERLLYHCHSISLGKITDVALDIASWINCGFMVTPTKADLETLEKSNPRIAHQHGAFFVFGNQTNPSNVVARSDWVDTITIIPAINNDPILIRPDTRRRNAVNVIIPKEWKPDIIEALAKMNITREYLLPGE